MKVLKVIVGEVEMVEEHYVVVNLADSIHDFLQILKCPKDVSYRGIPLHWLIFLGRERCRR